MYIVFFFFLLYLHFISMASSELGGWSVSSDQQSESVCLVQARLIRIHHMVSSNEFRCVIELCDKEPQSFFLMSGNNQLLEKDCWN